MKDYSIEYAHIYTNQDIDLEKEFSTGILNNFFNQNLNTSCSLAVMVDDYSFPDPSFDYQKFNTYLSDKGYVPDIMIRESQLIPVCDILLSLINDKKLKHHISKYIIKNKKYPCSLFIASWYLLRLGNIQHPIFDIEFSAKNLINILPESFKPFEEKAFDIIKSTQFHLSVSCIQNKYFIGRDL